MTINWVRMDIGFIRLNVYIFFPSLYWHVGSTVVANKGRHIKTSLTLYTTFNNELNKFDDWYITTLYLE